MMYAWKCFDNLWIYISEGDYFEINYLGTKIFEDKLFAEIRGRIKEDDTSAPLRKGPYYYYERTLKGKEYVQHCRRLISDCKVAPSVYDTFPTEVDAPQEHIILDENIKAQHHGYYSIGAFKVRAFIIVFPLFCYSFLLLQTFLLFRLVQITSW